MSSQISDPTVEELQSHAHFLRGLARDLLRDEHLADDVVQETFMAALTHKGARPLNTRAWLAGVLRNRFRMAVRGGRRREERELHARPSLAGARPPDEVASTLEVQRRTLDAVLALPEAYRKVIVHRYFHDCGPTEIARRLHLPVETVRSQHRRALARLRSSMDRDHGGNRAVWRGALLPLVGTGQRGSFASFPLGAAIMKTKLAILLVLLPLLGLLIGAVGYRALAPAPPVPAPDPGQLEDRVARLTEERDALLLEVRDQREASEAESLQAEQRQTALLARIEELGRSPGKRDTDAAAPTPKEIARTDWDRLSRAIVAWAEAEEAGLRSTSSPRLALEVAHLMERLRAMAKELDLDDVNDVLTHPSAFPRLVRGVLRNLLPAASAEARESIADEIAAIQAALVRGQGSPSLPLEKRALDAGLAWETAAKLRGRIQDEELERLIGVLGAARPVSYRIGLHASSLKGLHLSVLQSYGDRLALESTDREVARGMLTAFVDSHLAIAGELTRRFGPGAIERAFPMGDEKDPAPSSLEERLRDLEVRAKLLTLQAEVERHLHMRLSPDAGGRMLDAPVQILLFRVVD